MNVIIIGNGVAGVSAAETIRAADKNCGIMILSDEAYPFYSRPQLIGFLSGTTSVESITVHAQAWYDRNFITFKTSTRVAGIDTKNKKITGDGGMETAYDKLIIASGASGLLPPVHGISAGNVTVLRTIDDARKIKEFASRGKCAVVIGGGLLGIEAANSLRMLGIQVKVLEIYPRLLPRQLDDESSAVFQRMLEEKGLAFITGTTIRTIERDMTGGLRIALSDGKENAADFAVVSVGIAPRISLCEGTEIRCNRGIVVDDFMRTTVQDIYACGDAAEHRGVIYGLWSPAREQGIACGAHILGKEARYNGTINSVRLRVAGIELASIGDVGAKEGVATIIDKDEPAGYFKKIFLRGRQTTGAILIGNTREASKLQQKIKNGEQYSA